MAKTALCSGFFALAWGVEAGQSSKVYEPCINYYQPGLSGCESKPVSKPVAAASPTAIKTSSYAENPVVSPTGLSVTLDQKIDEFLKNQGKPPREFVAFYLEPTPENALRWAYKFQELQQRNVQITEAWTQAEQLVLNAQARGMNVAALASETLPPVQPISGPLLDWTNLSGDGLAGTLALPVAPTAVTGLTGLGNPINTLAPSITVAGLSLPLPPGVAQPGQAPRGNIAGTPQIATAANPRIPVASSDSFDITYYFSSECPFCQQFEPEFIRLKQDLTTRLNITCVDVSPPGTPPKMSLESSLGCNLRKPTTGEIEKMGLKTTPTLIVRRGNAMQLDRINGYIPGDKLKAWLLTGSDPS